jgi:hypothetical protein
MKQHYSGNDAVLKMSGGYSAAFTVSDGVGRLRRARMETSTP